LNARGDSTSSAARSRAVIIYASERRARFTTACVSGTLYAFFVSGRAPSTAARPAAAAFSLVQAVAGQRRLGLGCAIRNGRDAAEDDPRLGHDAVFHGDHGCDAAEREVPDLAHHLLDIDRLGSGGCVGNVDGRQDLVRKQDVFPADILAGVTKNLSIATVRSREPAVIRAVARQGDQRAAPRRRDGR
jgi:hypothetical protein